MRVGVYYAPRFLDPLWELGATWLGRDPETNAPIEQPNIPNIAEVTADARMYGFHATLKPPMALRAGVTWDQVVTAAEEAGFPVLDLSVSEPTLETVFINLTGKELRD